MLMPRFRLSCSTDGRRSPGCSVPTSISCVMASIPPAAVKALCAVLPADCQLIPVGGITPEAMAPYRAAGAAGFGLGSALYRPGKELPEILAAARAFAAEVSRAASTSFESPRAAR